MARIRTIKPEFWTSEQIMECSRDARLLFIGIWNFADDDGRFAVSLKRLKAQILPSDDDATSANIRRWLDELSTNGLILIYPARNSEQIAQITGWHHQKIDRRNPSKLPPPPNASASVRRLLVEQSPPEGKGREGIEEPSHEVGISQVRDSSHEADEDDDCGEAA